MEWSQHGGHFQNAIGDDDVALAGRGQIEAQRCFDDHQFALELLEAEGVLIVPGSSFNVPYRDHFRVTLLPQAGVMGEVFGRIDRALARRAEAATKVVPLKAKTRTAAA